MHFAAGNLPPVNGFWSLTLYTPDHYFVPNAIDRYTLRDTALRRNADGSIDVVIQHESARWRSDELAARTDRSLPCDPAPVLGAASWSRRELPDPAD